MDTVLRGLIQVILFQVYDYHFLATSGGTEACAQWIYQLYGSIIEAGVYLLTIKVAEASKVRKYPET